MDGLPGPHGIVLFHRVVHLFSKEIFTRTENRVGKPLVYPDGSLQFDCPSWEVRCEIFKDFGSLISGPGRPCANKPFRDLGPFHEPTKKWYTLLYDQDYYDQLGEDMLCSGAAGGMRIWPGEYLLNRMPFQVRFKRKPNEQVRNTFVACIRKWLKSVAQGGLFSEGPIVTVDNQIEFRGKRVNLTFDLSRSGPHTMIWLVLTVLEFGHAIALIDTAVFMSNEAEAFKGMVECSRKSAAHFGEPDIDDATVQKWWEEQLGGPESAKIIVPL